jgi:hypothetical protein
VVAAIGLTNGGAGHPFDQGIYLWDGPGQFDRVILEALTLLASEARVLVLSDTVEGIFKAKSYWPDAEDLVVAIECPPGPAAKRRATLSYLDMVDEGSRRRSKVIVMGLPRAPSITAAIHRRLLKRAIRERPGVLLLCE